MVGPNWRHGPHHGAQKSTRTGWADWATSACQFSDVNSTTFLLAMERDSVAGGRSRLAPARCCGHFSQGPEPTPEGRGPAVQSWMRSAGRGFAALTAAGRKSYHSGSGPVV